ncbi:helix-turn-helix transcriptional regulator [Amycolatopsis sp. K13G38]|uniref:Helix-turn-helix transcriptional regulator n=1 Tax=Amycolatopsis acididurans TaxID=2724524 RepID=A0ABX1JK98_9PSEU|nr:helix-turn-helix transcriptional regulator [Amycolatopsis acididurans]NKQ59345.1 helix-turn-helix transcriptional regulator [Amycolatopsis acididurans]
MPTLADAGRRSYELAFGVLERIDGAHDLAAFKAALTAALAEVYQVRSTTFFTGRTAPLACADPAPTIIGITRHMLPEYQDLWFQHDIFSMPHALRSLITTRVSTLSELNGGTPENRMYVTDYLERHGIQSATAIYLDISDGRKALVGMFDRDPGRIGPQEVESLRLLAGPLAQIACHLPVRARTAPVEDTVLSRLSPRQAEVARLVGEGMSNASIGEVLHLHPASVKKYVTRILAITGLRNRTELAIAVRRSASSA